MTEGKVPVEMVLIHGGCEYVSMISPKITGRQKQKNPKHNFQRFQEAEEYK